MTDDDKTREQLIEELAQLRDRIVQFEASRRSTGNGGSHWQPDGPVWHSLVANTPVFILILDQHQRICFANHTDSGAATSQIVGRSFLDFCRPQVRDSVRNCVEQVFQTGKPSLLEGPALRLDDQEHWYASHFGPILEDGEVVAVSVVAINVTDHKRAQEAVRQSGQRLRLHVEQTPLAVIEWNLELRVSKWNPGAERIFGYSEEQALGREFAFLVPPEVREHLDPLWAALRAKKGGERSSNENITKDGRTILCEWYNTPLVSAEGQVVGFASLAEDITERKRAEQESARNRAMLEAAIDSLPFEFFAIGPDGRYSMQNAVGERYAGHLIGKRPEDVCSARIIHATPLRI
jgi:PAS domain S-box-containing protein